jgi:N-acetylglucosaminyldiphosphoundecaprenol N-acetyl-beta-D-mannosaminyltransferase
MNSIYKAIKILNTPQSEVLSRMGILNLNDTKVVHLLNTYNLALANSNREYFRLLAKSEYNFVDGKLLQVTLSKVFRVRIYQIRGVDLMKSILSASPNGVNHLFICPNDLNSDRLQEKIAQENPSLESDFVVPAFSDDIETLAREISEKTYVQKFDYIWVGIGTPKQDFLAQELSNVTSGTYIICIGAALDFLAGTKKEAPRFIQNMGLEWLFRFIQEPRRLFKRYFIKSWGFFLIILRGKIEIEAQ